MKNFFLLLISTILFIRGAHILKCLDETLAENEDQCYLQLDNTIYVRTCPSHQFCVGIVERWTCMNYTKYNFNGESCDLDSECYSSQCKDKKCVVNKIGESCKFSHSECENDAFCDRTQNKCVKYFKEGEVCPDFNTCEIGYDCDYLNENDEEKICIKLFSLKNGEKSPSNKFCESGFLDQQGICTDLEYNGTQSVSVSCESDLDCNGYTIIDEQRFNYTGTCSSVSPMYDNYCLPVATTGTDYKNYIEMYKDILKNFDKKGKIHPYTFSSNPLLYDSKFREAMLKTMSGYIEMPDCWKDFMNQMFGYINYSSSSLIVYSKFMFMIMFLLIF